MRRDGLRVVLAGASGALGGELARVLGELSFPLAELYPFATDRSVGADVDVADDSIPVEASAPALQGYDLLFVCTPRAAALDLVRDALRAELPCIDCSGALVRSSDVPLGLAGRSPAAELVGAPVIAAPAGPSLAWGRLLTALDDIASVASVRGTVVQTASAAGRDGIDALSEETLALLAGQEPAEPAVFATGVAFDCLPSGASGVRADGADEAVEAEAAAVASRLLGRDVPLALSAVQVPAFIGEGSQLSIEFDAAVDPVRVSETLDKVPGLRVLPVEAAGLPGPTTRDASGEDDVLVGAVRSDPTSARGLRLWVVADPVRLAATNAVKLAEARLRRH